jgi:hypothetical protein
MRAMDEHGGHEDLRASGLRSVHPTPMKRVVVLLKPGLASLCV